MFVCGRLSLLLLYWSLNWWRIYDWLINYIVFYALSAIFRPYKDGRIYLINRCCMAEILPIWCKTLNDQPCDEKIKNYFKNIFYILKNKSFIIISSKYELWRYFDFLFIWMCLSCKIYDIFLNNILIYVFTLNITSIEISTKVLY